MSSSLRRSRFRVRVPEEDPAVDADVGCATEGSSDSSFGEYDSEPESMTGKGIMRLCSELLELKKASDEDFQRNVYSNYSAFVRIFEEVGGVESELMELKQHVSTQRKLVQVLMNSFYVEIVTDGIKDIKVEDLGLCSPGSFGNHMQEILETLDILLSEHRLEEALDVLEKETLTLQEMAEDRLSPIIMSYAYTLSERRTTLADQFSLMAEHPRVAQPELQKALSGLCRLGENHRANFLLLKFYRSRLQKNVHELQCSKPCLHGTYVRELAKIVFSAISQAARCFITLYGETSPYTSELIQWAREETEIFSNNFNTYVKSISEMNGGLSLAVEAANNAIAFCSLLKYQRIVLQSDLMKLIRPCMEEVLQIHVDHFKKVIHIFTATDNWVLGKFLILGILRDKSSLTGLGDKVEYCLLTSSGRKFVTLMQAIVDDISPLVTLRIGSSILKGLADLFNEYMCALERAIPSRGNAAENYSPRISSAQTLMQQLSLLVNSSTLVHFFPSIAGSIFKGIGSSNSELLSDHTQFFPQNELDYWMLSIQEAADQLRGYFCQQFVYAVMSRGDFESATCLDGWCIPSSSHDPVPSLAFQALFVLLRQLEEHSKSIFVGEDGMMEKVLKEIVETLIVWISNNQEFWTNTVELSCIRHCSCFEQVQLDMHFLVEIARLGGYFSDELMVSALDLIAQMEVAFTTPESDPNSAVLDEGWASNAAKLAIKKLLEAEAANSEPEEEPAATSDEDLSTQKWEDKCPSDVEHSIGTSEDSAVLLDGELANSVDNDITKLIEINDIVPQSFEGQTGDVMTDNYDDEGSRSPTIQYADMEDGRDATRADTWADELSEIEGIEELEVEGLTTNPEVESVGNLDECDAIAAQPATDKPQDTGEKENLVQETELLEEIEGLEELEVERLATNSEAESVGNLDECNAIAAQRDTDEPQDIAEKENLVLETELLEVSDDLNISVTHSNNSDAKVAAEVDNDPSDALVKVTRLDLEKKSVMLQGLISEEVVQVDWSKVADETAMSEPQSIEKEDKLVSGKYTELALDKSLQKQGRDGINPVRGGGNSSSVLVPLRGGRERSKDANAAEGLGKNGKGKAPRPRWH